MKEVKFYTFNEKPPKHEDKIIVFGQFGDVDIGYVDYPYVHNKKKYKEDFFEVRKNNINTIYFDEKSYYVNKKDIPAKGLYEK